MSPEEKKQRQRESDIRRKQRIKAAKEGREGPPLLRVTARKRPHAKTAEEKAEREADRKARNILACKDYRERHPERRAEVRKKSITKHRDARNARLRTEEEKAKRRKKQSERYANDLDYRLRKLLSDRTLLAIKHRMATKSAKTIALVGCDIDALKEHLERQFEPGMSWENFGSDGWHIDHIRPCSSFDLIDPEQQKICFHYTNLQPLWAIDNLRKGAKLDWAGSGQSMDLAA